ncbi:MAG: Crp/Fnr family transcriptional regulator [Abitibacteriaceae bacterium]|nr:Crp/Fnr family transcriptional regulator [Abditibacteriaceae bacterium]MBV9864331.1 Crp/Fnr family transcriptional regulator [Abditibacteriaceae bacterium]
MAIPLPHQALAASPNLLLSALPPNDYQRILPYLKPVALEAGRTLYEAGQPIQRVYFPTECTISLLMSSAQGTDVEVNTVGREGFVDVITCLGGGPSLYRAMVLTKGRAWQMPAAMLKQEFRHGGMLHELLLRYLQNILAQSAQTALCCRLHSVEERLCCWLLSVHDRVEQDELELTQELVAHVLGVRRVSVTEAMAILRQAELIRCTRGHITVLDRVGLERRACECYHAVGKNAQVALQASHAATRSLISTQQPMPLHHWSPALTAA